jgi:hypothetical protein
MTVKTYFVNLKQLQKEKRRAKTRLFSMVQHNAGSQNIANLRNAINPDLHGAYCSTRRRG